MHIIGEACEDPKRAKINVQDYMQIIWIFDGKTNIHIFVYLRKFDVQ